MDVSLKSSGDSSYLLPTYRFLLKIINGENVLSYSKSCGAFSVAVINFPTSSVSSWVATIASRPSSLSPVSGFRGLNETKIESVSPYTIAASHLGSPAAGP
jgi:hypothetical protein